MVPEKSYVKDVAADEEDGPEEDDEEVEVYASQVPAIILDILQNRNSVIFMGFLFTTCASYMIDLNLSPVYLTNEVSFEVQIMINFLCIAQILEGKTVVC